LVEVAPAMIICPSIDLFVTANYAGAGTRYLVQTVARNLYCFYVDGQSDLGYKKSTDGGRTWSKETVIFVGSVQTVAVWYDRWSNIAAGLIHLAYTETASDDILYRNIDTENNDSLGTQTTVFAGSTAIAGGSLSITRARGNNLIVAGSIDAGNEDGAWESTDVGATWGSAIADPSEAGTEDQYLLLPGWNADTQDVMLIFWDASADELSVKRYDNSANSWAETSIATSMVDIAASAGRFPNVAAAVDLTNSQNIVVAWSDTDVLNADLRCWKINDTTITEMTNVVENSTDDQGLCTIGIDTITNIWHVMYGGKSDGSETWNTALQVYGKTSSDAGSTWSAEVLLTNLGLITLNSLNCVPRSIGPPIFEFSGLENLVALGRIRTEGIMSNSSYQMGVM